jgi:septum formation protein
VPSAVDESLTPGLSAAEGAGRLALAKARDVAARPEMRSRLPSVVLGADTLVTLDGRVFGKPASREEARAMLAALRDRVHEVVTGVALVETAAGREACETVVSRVVMRPYAAAEIRAYVETGEPDDKAGAYGLQGEGSRLVLRVEGCYTNVIGLPLGTTARLLRAFGLPVTDPATTAGAGEDPGTCGPR